MYAHSYKERKEEKKHYFWLWLREDKKYIKSFFFLSPLPRLSWTASFAEKSGSSAEE